MATMQSTPVLVESSGSVPADVRELAAAKIAASLRHTAAPVLSARVTLAQAPDPAVDRPATASAHIDVNGRQVLAHATAETLPAAVELLAARLKVRLAKASAQQAVRRRPPDARPGGGGLPSLEPDAMH